VSVQESKVDGGWPMTQRLLAHLKMGGSRKGACGSAGISYRELCARLEADQRFAEAVEEAECEGLARDEQRLAVSVEDGDRQSLLFRLRRAYKGEKNGKRAGVINTDDSTRKEYEKIAGRLGELTEKDRQKVVQAVRGDRETAGAVA
jgi:hypothetical protein